MSSKLDAKGSKIKLYPISDKKSPIKPGERYRDWMSPHSYRCLPLTAANTYGWDILCPEDVEVEWFEGKEPGDVHVYKGSCESHFGIGTITFSVGYTWHTEPGTQLMIIPVPNSDFVDLQALSAIVETDELKYPFFVTLRFTRPGTFNIPKGTPIARVIPIRMTDVIDASIEESPEPFDFKIDRNVLAEQREKDAKEGGRKPWTKIYHKQAKYTVVNTPEVEFHTQIEGLDYLKSKDIQAIPDFLSKEECKAMIDLLDKSTPSKSNDLNWTDRIYWIRPEEWPKGIYEKLTSKVILETESFFNKKFEQTDLHMVQWREGHEMRPHSDYAHGAFPHRDYNVIIYLNDDYEGGELVLPTLDTEIIPQAGSLISFHGGNIYHGVKKITKGRRLTCISWLKDLNK